MSKVFSHIYDRRARITITSWPKQPSKENKHPDPLAYGYEEGDETLRPYNTSELVPVG